MKCLVPTQNVTRWQYRHFGSERTIVIIYMAHLSLDTTACSGDAPDMI